MANIELKDLIISLAEEVSIDDQTDWIMILDTSENAINKSRPASILGTNLDQIRDISTSSNDDVLQKKGGVWTNRTIAQLRADLGISSYVADLAAKADVTGEVFTGNIEVPSEVYGIAWNNSAQVPTKGDVYDKIESLLLSGGYNDESAQDAIGSILLNTSDINFTYDDTTPSISAVINNSAVTYSKIQNVSATDRLLGRDTTGSGVIEELIVTGGLEFTGSGGIRRSALTGDVIATAGSNSTTLDKISGRKITVSTTAPSSPTVGDIWLDVS